MWSQSSAENVRSSFMRIKKINLSNASMELFENTIFSYAYPPADMDDKEFTELKINWLIENKRIDLVEKFLNKMKLFITKKVIQYVVDNNIAKANIKEGCEKISFIDKNIKD